MKVTALVAVAALASGCGLSAAGADQPAPRPTASPGRASAGATGTAIRAELAKVRVAPSRPDAHGYRRAEFGAAWTDNHNGKGGHNHCKTRDDVLAAQLQHPQLRDRCVVVAGTLIDPYTGRVIPFSKADAAAVQIDHVYPLKRAWDLGAAAWPRQRRIDFANDQTLNLTAVDGPTNASKGDDGPGEWLPISKAYRCAYVLRYLRVARAYSLQITANDRDAAQAITKICP
jgi:hypothetical protein